MALLDLTWTDRKSELPDELWERIVASPRRLLMLDYDGTLAPFRTNRMEARTSAQARAMLAEICLSPRDRVAIVSGRPMAELRQLLPGLAAHYVAEHGWEEHTVDGRRIVHPLPGDTARRLGLAARAANACGWRAHLERKRCSLVLHTRGLEPGEASRLLEDARRLWGSYFEREGLRLDRIDGGLELRATERHKGTVVSDLMRDEPESALPVYLGDDRTDEDAFQRVRQAGLAIRVGDGVAGSHAPFRLAGIREVEAFLGRWRGLVHAESSIGDR